MTTSRKLAIVETGSLVKKPVAVLSVQRIDAVMGSIIQLDGRKSYDPSKKPLVWKWRFSQYPIGSVVESSGFRDIRPKSAAVSFVPDKTGFYVVELIVNNGDLDSDPITAVVSIQLSRVPCGENIVPEARFLWNYISNFWSLVEDREYITSIWSSTMQLIGAELIKLWEADYDKSLSTIQTNRQRRWQKFSAVTDLLTYGDQRIIVGRNDSGAGGYTGTPGVRPGDTTTAIVYVPTTSIIYDPGVKDGSVAIKDFSRLKGNYGPSGRVLVVNGQCYTIQQVGTTSVEIAYDAAGVTAFSNELSSSTVDFVLSKVKPGDRVVVASGADAGTYLVGEVTSSSLLKLTHVDGSATAFSGTSGIAYQIDRVFTTASVREGSVPDGQVNVQWRIPNLLHIPAIDLEAAGVRKGDLLVFDVIRKDTGLSSELRAQVVGVTGSRVGFEFELGDLQEGVENYSRDLFSQLIRDLKIVPPEWSDSDAARMAEAFIAFIPSGVNLNTRPFSSYKFILKAKKIIHNTVLVGDSTLVSVPALQECPKNPPIVLRENLDYIVDGGNIQFISGIFLPTDPCPETWWGECAFYDNSKVIENNFGRLVGLTKDDFDQKRTRTSYLSAVKGLFYAYTSGSTVANVRLGLQILLGLPFAEERGLVLEVAENFSLDSSGQPIGRILIEDVDENDRRTGLRRFYFYPMEVGVETNSSTGNSYVAGDIVEQFAPLSKGVEVTDYVKDPVWWKRALYGLEILKFFTFYVSIDGDVFSSADRALAFDFLEAIKPKYSKVLVSALKVLEDDIEVDDVIGGHASMILFDAAWGLEATPKVSDDNHQGFSLGVANYPKTIVDGLALQNESSRLMCEKPFHTRTPRLLKDVRTYEDSGFVYAYTDSGWGNFVRGRQPALVGFPYMDGDLLVILPGQPGSFERTIGAYEIVEVVDSHVVKLNSAELAADRYRPVSSALDVTTFPYGSNLLCCVVRKEQNPIIRGTDLQTSASSNIVTSASAQFISNAAGSGDILVIESGVNMGAYFINSVIPFSSGPPQVPPSISETQVRLVNKDGSTPSFTALSSQGFRVARPVLRPRAVCGGSTVGSPGAYYLLFDEAGASNEPLDVFTPDMVGSYVNVARSSNPTNDGRFLVTSYSNAGKAFIDNMSAVSEIVDTAVVYLDDETELSSLRIKGKASVTNKIHTVGTNKFSLDPGYTGSSFLFGGPPSVSPIRLGVLPGDLLHLTGPVGSPNVSKTVTITGTGSTTSSFSWGSPTAIGAPFAWMDAIAYGAGRWVAVGGRHTGYEFRAAWTTSTDDGATWSAITYFNEPGGVYDLTYATVAYDPVHSKWLAVFKVASYGGSGGSVRYSVSSDGTTWSDLAMLYNETTARLGQSSLAHNGIDRWYLVTNNTSAQSALHYSTDGTTWSSVVHPTGDSLLQAMTYDVVSGQWVAVGYKNSNSHPIYCRTYDGVNWGSIVEINTSYHKLRSVTTDGLGRHVAIGIGTSGYINAITSTNGTTWSSPVAIPSDTMGDSGECADLAYGNGLWVVCCAQPGPTNYPFYAYSSDGMTWTATSVISTLYTMQIWSACFGGTKLITVGRRLSDNCTMYIKADIPVAVPFLDVYQPVLSDPSTAYEYEIERRKS
jgi:hypothetical protein